MRSRSALLRGIEQLLGRDRADPRFGQYLFLVPVFVDMAFVYAYDNPDFGHRYGIGLLIVAIATVLAVAIGHDGLPVGWIIVIPALDIIATGFMELSAGSTASLTILFPAIWLGLQFGNRGVFTALVATALSFLVPILVGGNTLPVSWVVQEMVVVLICSMVVSVTAGAWQAKVDEAADAQKMLERAVSDSAEQRRVNEAILNSVDVGLLALDAAGRVNAMNPRHHRFVELAFPDGTWDVNATGFAYAADGVTELLPSENPTRRAIAGETLRDYLIWVGPDKQNRRAFAVSASPFFTPEGNFNGAVLAYHDVTDLMAAVRLKDEFVATVSHELRTPLTSIVGYVDLLLEDFDGIPVEARPFLVTVQRNARRLHRLVDDLLSDALKLGRAELHLGRVSLAGIVRAAALDAENAAQAAGLQIELDLGTDALEVHGDAERLAQVIDNILSNAVKFTPAGGRILATLRQEDREVVVKISDTGRGIPPDELEDVFVTFFRSPGVQVDAIPGTGLGLAICKTIIEAHGGSIGVTSIVGQGTTLEVRLPLAGPRVARAG